MVVAIRLVVLGISQPPSAAVCSLPRTLLRRGALHGVLGATTTLVGGTSHVNNQVGLLRVVVDVLAHSVVHFGPVALVARRPDLETLGTRVLFSALLDALTIVHPDEFAGGVSLYFGTQISNFAIARTTGCALKRRFLCCWLAQVSIGLVVAVAVIETHVVRIHIVHVQVTVGMVVAIRLVVLGISQPPSAAVCSLPRTLLRRGALHRILGATTTLVGGTSHVNNQVGLARVVLDVLAHS